MSNNLISQNQLSRLRFVQGMFTVGPVLVFLILIYFYLTGKALTNLEEHSKTVLIALTAVHFALLGLLFPFGIVLSQRFLNRFEKQRGTELAGKLVSSSHLIRIGIMQIPTYWGLFTLFMAVRNGLIYDEFLFWVNAISFFINTAQNVLLYPSDDTLERLYGYLIEE